MDAISRGQFGGFLEFRRIFAGVLFVGALSLLLSTAGRAQEKTGLHGFYSFTDVTASAETVTLTLNLRLFNSSGTDLTNATLTLHDSSLPSTIYGQFLGVTLPAGQSAVFSKRVNVPRREYQAWQQGRHPNFVVEYTDIAGHQISRPVQLLAGAVGGN